MLKMHVAMGHVSPQSTLTLDPEMGKRGDMSSPPHTKMGAMSTHPLPLTATFGGWQSLLPPLLPVPFPLCLSPFCKISLEHRGLRLLGFLSMVC